MTARRLTDARLTAGLRELLPVADVGLHERILAEITTTPQDRRLPSILGRLTDADTIARRRTVLLVAVLALTLAVSVSAIAGALLRESPTPDLTVTPELEPTMTPEARELIRGWPGTGENFPGLYSWDGSQCAQAYCNMGFMHNGYGSGDVEIQITSQAAGLVTNDGAKPVVVAGYDGIYRRVEPGVEEWVADIEGTTVTIRMEAPGASADDLAEAHAIIDTLRAVPDDNGRGLSLIFRLTTNDWDSG
jgi:hypothetical protein